MMAEVAANTGRTFDQVEALTLSRLRALRRSWRDFPPLRITAALALGIKPEDQAGNIPTKDELEDLIREIHGG